MLHRAAAENGGQPRGWPARWLAVGVAASTMRHDVPLTVAMGEDVADGADAANR